MGNGQSSPSGPGGSASHPGPGQQQQHLQQQQQQQQHHHHHPAKPQSHHIERPSSPANKRRKSLELPDLASLSFTSATPTSSTSANAPYGGPGSSGGRIPSPGGGRGGMGRNPLSGKKPNPLQPAMSIAPLSSSTRPTKSSPLGQQPQHHNPYFPATPTPIPIKPVAIPNTNTAGNEAPLSGLPEYSRMTYSEARGPLPGPVGNASPAYAILQQQAETGTLPSPIPQQPTPSTEAPTAPPTTTTVASAGADGVLHSGLPVPVPSKGSLAQPELTKLTNSPLIATSSANTSGRSSTAAISKTSVAGPAVGDAVPTLIQWSGGGKEVYVCGTFAKNWQQRLKMNKSTHDFSVLLSLPPGPHRLKFIVDESWRCSDEMATAVDADGSLVNYIEVAAEPKEGDPKSEWGLGWEGAHSIDQDADDGEAWTSEIPPQLVELQAIEEAHNEKREQSMSTGRPLPDVPKGFPQPPPLPKWLDKVILNNVGQASPGFGGLAEAGGATVAPDDNSILPIPNHVVLNHLTASAIRNGTLAVGTTTRYKRKYISTLLYKPVEI